MEDEWATYGKQMANYWKTEGQLMEDDGQIMDKMQQCGLERNFFFFSPYFLLQLDNFFMSKDLDKHIVGYVLG